MRPPRTFPPTPRRSARRLGALLSGASVAIVGLMPGVGGSALAQDPPPLPVVEPASTAAPAPPPVDPTTSAPPPTTSQATAPPTTTPTAGPTTATSAAAPTTAAGKAGTTTTVKAPARNTAPPANPGAARRNARGQYLPNGRPPGPAVPFDWASATLASQQAAALALTPAANVLSVLIIGSDARPKENPQRSRGDSIHLVLWNQSLGRGTVLGIPRDTWVPIPGRGQSKVNASLSWGGPELMRASVAGFTGIPVSRWIVTGFDGFTRLINELGGIAVEVTTSMNDPYSGAQFAPGWFSMNGDAALALVRNRKDGVAGGDVGRSRNQGLFLLALLAKAREQTRSSRDLGAWVAVARKHVASNAAAGDLVAAAHLARSIDPAAMSVVVLPVQNAKIGATSAQTITPVGTAMLADLRSDGVLNGR